MSSEPVHVRPQHLQRLGQFSLTLVEVLEQSATAPDKLREAVRSAWSGECVQCGIQVTGEELLARSEERRVGKACGARWRGSREREKGRCSALTRVRS